MRRKNCSTLRMQQLRQERQAAINAFASGKMLSWKAIRLRRMYEGLIAEEENRHKRAVKNFKVSSRNWRKKDRHEI